MTYPKYCPNHGAPYGLAIAAGMDIYGCGCYASVVTVIAQGIANGKTPPPWWWKGAQPSGVRIMNASDIADMIGALPPTRTTDGPLTGPRIGAKKAKPRCTCGATRVYGSPELRGAGHDNWCDLETA